MDEKREKSGRGAVHLTVDDLKKKQSVRATFRLSPHVIKLLSVTACQLGIKQKSLFDQLIEDSGVLGQVARDAEEYHREKTECQQKTFVISRSSLLSLNKIAKRENVPRDFLVEVSIKRLLPIVDSELERHKKRKRMLADMKDYLYRGQQLLTKIGEELGEDDLLYEMVRDQMEVAQKNIVRVDAIVEKGTAMEEW